MTMVNLPYRLLRIVIEKQTVVTETVQVVFDDIAGVCAEREHVLVVGPGERCAVYTHSRAFHTAWMNAGLKALIIIL